MITGFLFRTWLYAWTLVVGVLGLPLLLWSLIARKTLPAWFTRLWGQGCLASLKLCGIELQYRGLGNIPKGSAIIASKHESALETLAYYVVLDAPAYVLKRELYYLPIVGWYLARAGMLAINRNKRVSALRLVMHEADKTLKQGRKLVIFPEGTRAKQGEAIPYNKSVYKLYQQGYMVVPASLNSGKIWQKGRFSFGRGTVIFSFLPAIEAGLSVDEFMQKLRHVIEEEAQKL